jgi:hypothetical protein
VCDPSKPKRAMDDGAHSSNSVGQVVAYSCLAPLALPTQDRCVPSEQLPTSRNIKSVSHSKRCLLEIISVKYLTLFREHIMFHVLERLVLNKSS